MAKKKIEAPPTARCTACPDPVKCGCKRHATQQECYNYGCPCAEEARKWFFAHKDEVQEARAKEIATAANPLCDRCQKRLAEPGNPRCFVCIEEIKATPKVYNRQIEME